MTHRHRLSQPVLDLNSTAAVLDDPWYAAYKQTPQDWEWVESPFPGWYSREGREFFKHVHTETVIAIPKELVVAATLPAHNTNYHSQIVLGERYREEDTGFEGIAQSIYFYRNSCERVELERYNRKLGLESLVFDAKRLVHIDASGKEIKKLSDSPRAGGPDRGHPQRVNPSR